MADIIVDTYKLGQYAQRLSSVNSRINRLDHRMDSLYTKVGLLGLWNLMQADALTGYSWRLLRCQVYLNQTARDFEKLEKELNNEDPLSFDKSLVSVIQKTTFDVGVAIKKGAEKVSGFVAKKVNDVLVSYYSQGTVYQIVQYGKATLKAAKGIVKIATGVGSLLASGGLSAPVAVLSIISGCNDVYNAIMDGTYTYVEEYDKIGQNALKDMLVEGGKTIGASLGNEKIGEVFGTVTYYGIDIVTSLAALEVSMDKIKQLSSTNMAKMGAEIKEIPKPKIRELITMDIETLRYETKLASYTFKETTKFISNASEIIKVGAEAVEVGKGINDIYTSLNPDFENPVLDTIDTITNIKTVAKGSLDIATWNYNATATKAKQVESLFVRTKNKGFLKGDVFFSKSFSEFAGNIERFENTIESGMKSGKKLYEEIMR